MMRIPFNVVALVGMLMLATALTGCNKLAGGESANIPPEAAPRPVEFAVCAAAVPQPAEGEYTCQDIDTQVKIDPDD